MSLFKMASFRQHHNENIKFSKKKNLPRKKMDSPAYKFDIGRWLSKKFTFTIFRVRRRKRHKNKGKKYKNKGNIKSYS